MHPSWSDLAIVTYLFIAWCWNLPDDSPGKRLVKPLSRFVSWMGLWHGWNMFAPNPIRSSTRLAVQVEYSDGSRYEWRPPGTLPEGYWLSFLHAHHRKFSDNVAAGKVNGLRWSLADFALRRLAEKVPSGAMAVHVAIVQESWPIKPGEIQQAGEPERKVLFQQRLTDGVLK